MEWTRGHEIGHGSFSKVNLAVQKQKSSQFPQIMAVKSASVSQSDMLLREKSILEKLNNCSQIIKCFGGDYSIENGERLYNLFLEYATGGTLADKLKKQSDRRLPESEVRRYTKSILEGVKDIHENGYVHCDLKLENILLCGDDDVKIADFGLAISLFERREGRGVELRGTPLYMSPEVVSGGNTGAPADIWALGCMVAEMISGAPAWRCKAEAGVLPLLMRIGVGEELPEVPEELSRMGRDFLEKIFVKDSSQRWTAEMLLNHPFVVDQSIKEDSLPSVSPRGPLDWSNDSEATPSPCSITEIPLSDFDTWSSSQLDIEFDWSDRLRKLVTCQGPDWVVIDSWINVR